MALEASMPHLPAQWLRSVLPWGGGPAHQSPVDPVLAAHRRQHPRADVSIVRRAYEVAELAHRGQMRKSGEEYITHPLAVAELLADLGMDTITLAAALLHDTVEDTAYTLEQLDTDFGHEVSYLVDGVTKFDKAFYGDAAEAETYRKMMLSAGRDIRVLIIKLADRVHNMRTLGVRSSKSKTRIAQATSEVLIPLADRLGIQRIKRELEDIVFFHLDPAGWAEMDDYFRTQPERNNYLTGVTSKVLGELRALKVHADISPRKRHHWSLWNDRVRRGHLYDPPRLAIIVNGPDTDCYAALGAVHGLWRPLPGRFKDFIATPKFNLYQSLHTTVLGPGDQPVEFLIRTRSMHATAEYGIVAQFRAGGNGNPERNNPEQLEWLHRLLDWQRDAVDSGDFLTALRCDLSEEQIQVFTSGGAQVTLPSEATPVDLAYTLGDGDRMIGAYINGRLSPLSAPLSDGDRVEIIHATLGDEPVRPSADWLEFIRSPHARLQVSQWLAEHGYGEDIADQEAAPVSLGNKLRLGRSAIGLALRQRNRALASDHPLRTLAHKLGYPDLDALLVAVAERRETANELVERLIAAVDEPGAASLARG
ncbi:RelA/SpoT family protein [Longispora albida]|uniref:RelA/SpoT family protein n=1 Tax=Longispora albida TaxID=203523 RepID=UPI0003A646A2|nr:HD domain-containing protein [Longispora albida]